MPIYRVNFSWTETQFCSSEVEVEAEDEDSAREQAREQQYDDYETNDCENNGDTETEIECLDDEEEEAAPTIKRNLPVWF